MGSWEGKSNGRPFEAAGKAAIGQAGGMQRLSVLHARSAQATPEQQLFEALHTLMNGVGFDSTLYPDLVGLTPTGSLCYEGGLGDSLEDLKRLHRCLVRAKIPHLGKWNHQIGLVLGNHSRERNWLSRHFPLLQKLVRLPLPEVLPPVQHVGGKVVTEKQIAARNKKGLHPIVRPTSAQLLALEARINSPLRMSKVGSQDRPTCDMIAKGYVIPGLRDMKKLEL